MVIFGAAGDLTKRLVVPALYNLTTTRQLSDGFQLVGVDRTAKSTQEWRAGLTDTMKEFIGHGGEFEVDRIDQNAWQWLADRMSYLQGDLNDPETYRRLREHLAELDKAGTGGGRYREFVGLFERADLHPPSAQSSQVRPEHRSSMEG